MAVPHTKHPIVDKLVGTVGVSQDGIVWIDFPCALSAGEAPIFHPGCAGVYPVLSNSNPAFPHASIPTSVPIGDPSWKIAASELTLSVRLDIASVLESNAIDTDSGPAAPLPRSIENDVFDAREYAPCASNSTGSSELW